MNRPLRPRSGEPQQGATAPPQTDAHRGPRATTSTSSSTKARPELVSKSLSRATLAPKRRAVSSACEGCRQRKQRCDGARPVCGPCALRGFECSNTIQNEQLMSSRTVRNRNHDLQEENSKLWELYGFLFRLGQREADEVLARIRESGDPIAVLRAVKDSTLLMPNPDPYGRPTASDPRLDRSDLDALRTSPFRVTARPWTVVAGDGMVSELISSFFMWDDAFFYPFIHRKAFLDDMRQNDPDTAKHCSPFLVNAICASRCLTSSRVKYFDLVSQKDLCTQFLNEAKRLLDTEGGRLSLPTAQGLALLFTLSAYRGVDRAGMVYRYASYDMLRRLDLEKAFWDMEGDDTRTVDREIISKAVWGFFCFESIVGFVYLQLSLLPTPQIPRCFETRATETKGNLDILGNPYSSESPRPPFVPGVLDAICDLSLILYKSMLQNSRTRSHQNDEDNTKVRVDLSREVLDWRASLPGRFKDDINFTPQTSFLRIFVHEVIISALRPLSPDTIVWDGSTSKDICLKCNWVDLGVMERYFTEYSFEQYSCMALCGLYNTLLSVVFHLEDVNTHELFARTCRLVARTARDYPMARYILQGMRALIWSLDMRIPTNAAPYLDQLGGSKEELRDVPVAFILPDSDAMREFLNTEKDSQGQKGLEIGFLLSKWGALSVD